MEKMYNKTSSCLSAFVANKAYAKFKDKPQRHKDTKMEFLLLWEFNGIAKYTLRKSYLVFVILLFTQLTFGQAQTSDIASLPGAFSRMGFGARGMGMGNSMSAVKYGNVVSYYNPALSAFQNKNNFQTSYSFLSLDRSLNFLNYTKTFPFGTKQNEKGENEPRSIAGFSAGIINAGVSDIPQYDGSGEQTGNLSTSENQFFFSVSNRFSGKLAIGIAFKFYYYKLYEDVTSTSLGFDIGALYSLNDNITISAVLTDLNTKYKWDTSEIYGTNGKASEDKFPLLKKIGIAYKFDEPNIIAAVEFESSRAETSYLRFGAEYNIIESLFLRGGLDKWNLQNPDFPVRPSLGFSYFYKLNNMIIGVDYAFVIEPYSSSDQHIIGVNINF